MSRNISGLYFIFFGFQEISFFNKKVCHAEANMFFYILPSLVLGPYRARIWDADPKINDFGVHSSGYLLFIYFQLKV